MHTNTIPALVALDAGVDEEELVAWLSARERRTIYTPDTSISAAPPPLFGPHLAATLRHARSRGAMARRTRGDSISSATALSLAPAVCATLGISLFASSSGDVRRTGIALIAAYGAAVASSTLLAAVRFRSARVGLLAAPALVATQAAYVVGFLEGFAGSR
jgi:hypothetical protein